MEQLALAGGLLLLLAGLVFGVYRLGASRAEERIRRFLAEAQAKQQRKAVEAHGVAEAEAREDIL